MDSNFHHRFLFLAVFFLPILIGSQEIFQTTFAGDDLGFTGAQLCRDTDGGRNPNVRGGVCVGTKCAADVCQDSQTVTELTCSGSGAIASEPITCNTSCQKGSCLVDKPNFLLIMADDLDWELQKFMVDLTQNSTGTPEIILSNILTPNIDSLATSGAVFPNGLTSMSVCRPALATILSGQLPHENNIFANKVFSETVHLSPLNALPGVLGNEGYYSFIGGKWWEGDPADFGFTHIGALGGQFVRVSQDDLMNFFDQAKTDQKPFFVWYAPNLPHEPHNQTPAEFVTMYENFNIPIPAWVPPDQSDEYLNEQKMFYATVTWFDARIGDVLQKLNQTGQLANTVIIYMIDNGYSFNSPTPAKGSPYEKGMKSTIIVKTPWDQTPRILNQQAAIVDIPPTILDYAGIIKPTTWSGQSLKPIIANNNLTLRDNLAEGIYSGYIPTGEPYSGEEFRSALFAIIAKDKTKKYITYTRDEDFIQYFHPGVFYKFAGDEEFYDLAIDPLEQNNLINDPAYQTTIGPLRNSATQLKNQILGNVPRQSVSNKPACVFNQEYASPNDCDCRGNPAYWSVYTDSQLSCTPDGKTRYFCRDVVWDLENQKSVFPTEVMVRAKNNISLAQIKNFVAKQGAIIRKQPCYWDNENSFNNLIVETVPGKELDFISRINNAGLSFAAYQRPQPVCVTLENGGGRSARIFNSYSD